MVSTKSKPLRFAVLSDIHLGHRKNPTAEIIANLYRALPDNKDTAALDFIILAGDVFDDLLEFNQEDIVEIELWIADLLRLCKKHDIALRVLEGTPSHDWKQSNQFVSINEFAEIGADLKYVRELTLLDEERYGITMLFVPDEWSDTTEKTLSQVRSLMEARGITQVDYAVMHGQFDFQLPEHIQAPKHDSQAYLALVRNLIWIGHVHTHSHYERIYAQGSLDRLSHGQEEAKGHLRATVHPNGAYEVKFVETTQAKVFRTLKCAGDTVEETLQEVANVVGTCPEGSHLRLEVEVGHPIIGNLDILRLHYPHFTWSKEKVLLNGEPIKDAENDSQEELEYNPITITPENLERQVFERLHLITQDGRVLDAARTILNEVK